MNLFESIQGGKELLKQELSIRIERAFSNPIREERIAEIQENLQGIKENFITTGSKTEKQRELEMILVNEVLESSATASTLIEFKELLAQMVDIYGYDPEWALDTLEHENAHATVAISTGHDFICYALVFVESYEGSLVVDPISVTKDDINWGPEEALINNIKTTQAPEVYGNSLSEGDEDSIKSDNELLRRLRSKH